MEIVHLLVPLSVVLALIILGIFAWAVYSGQFDDLEREGGRILEQEALSRHSAEVESQPQTINQGLKS